MIQKSYYFLNFEIKIFLSENLFIYGVLTSDILTSEQRINTMFA